LIWQQLVWQQLVRRRLPAATAAAVTATVAAFSAPASTIAAAATAITEASASAAAGVLGFGTGFIYVESAAADLRAVQCGDGFVALFVVGHFHKTKAAGASGIAVGHDADAIHWSIGFEDLAKFVFRSIEVQVPHKNVFQSPPRALLSNCELDAADWQVGDTFLKIDTGAGGSRMRQKYNRFVNTTRQNPQEGSSAAWLTRQAG
jgi:hypothetical protein